MRTCATFVTLLVLGAPSLLATDTVLDLAGAWTFAMDAVERGEQLGWPKPDAGWKGEKPHPAAGWDAVTVPHDYLRDPRYAYTGVAWYRRSFAVPDGTEAERAWRLQFEQVSQRCRVWLNGEFIGAHEGGYTPFEFAVTPHVLPGRQNFLVVAVDNRVRFRSLPGARTGATATRQLFPWLNYGGILGAVRLVANPTVYVVRQQIEAQPDAIRGTAALVVHVRVRNTARESRAASVSTTVGDGWRAEQVLTLAPESEQIVTLRGELPAPAVKLWSIETPALYVAHTVVRCGDAENAREDTFGIRDLTMREGKFLLNGRPVRLAGANRALGDPVFGGRDPDEAVARDLGLMKAAGLRFARLQHVPPKRNLLDWADRNGMLLILEVGMWGYPADDLASTELREQFRTEMGELIALAVNHPSVVGWSLGNEYESWLPAGVTWTRDMAAFVKSLDPTRPVTFAALGTALRKLREGGSAGEHAFDHVDFISTNLYFAVEEMASFLDPVHVRWPGKPVLISEFGLRTDRVKDEGERIVHFDKMLALVQERPWICGLSFWSFNDYASHYPGTGADGYRRWGLVDEFRRPRALYEHVRTTLGTGGSLDAPAKP
jgi:beta-glucuronidase